MWKLLILCMLGAQSATNSSVQPPRPDFSGHWVEESRPAPPFGQLGFCPQECTIAQTAEKLSVKSALGTNTIDLLRPTVTTDARFAVAVEQTVTALWEEGTLVVRFKYKENTPAAATVSRDVRLTLKNGRLSISGDSTKPGSSPVPFEVIYRRVQ